MAVDLVEAYTDIRAALVGVIEETWVGAPVYAGDYQGEQDGDFVRLAIDGAIEIENDTPVTDVARLNFVIAGRFQTDQTLGAEMQAVQKVSALRRALLAVANPGDIGFSPHIQAVEVERLDVGNNVTDAVLRYGVSAVVNRGSDA